MAKKSYHAPAIIEASQFERRTLLTGCAKANPACATSVQALTSTCQDQKDFGQGSGTTACQQASYVS